MTRTSITVLAALAGAACAATAPRAEQRDAPAVIAVPDPIPLQRADTSMSGYHGGSHPGRSTWLSRNGRFAVIFQWRDDTDGDGQVRIETGYHGEMLADEPAPFLVDMQTGATARYDELLTLSAGRWLTLRDGQGVWLFDADDGTRTKLQDPTALPRNDENACYDPRALIFDEHGPRVGLLVDEPSHLRIRDLAGGDEWRVDAGEDVVWRARFTRVEDVVVLYAVPLDSARADSAGGLPREVTSCSNRLGMMFAASMSGSGWEGPPYYRLVVHRNGRRLRLEQEPIVVSDDVLALGDSVLLRMDGSRIELPSDCERLVAVPGAGVVLLDCAATTRILHAEQGRAITLPVRVRPVPGWSPVRDHHGDTWLPVRVHDPVSELEQVGRLRTRDGRIEIGPVASRSTRAQRGWILTRGTSTVHLLDVTTGRQYTVPFVSERGWVGFPALGLDPGWLLLDPANGRYLEVGEIGARSRHVGERGHEQARNDSGCYVAETGEYPADTFVGKVEQGPWQVRCAAD